MKKLFPYCSALLIVIFTTACSGDGDDTTIDTFIASISDTSFDFGDIATDTSSEKSFTINNTGTGSISITDITSNIDFTVSPTSTIIAAGSSKSFSITFSPDNQQAYNQIVSVSSNITSGTLTITLDGYGVEPFYKNTIAPIIAQNCSTTGCHSANDKRGGIAMTNFLESKNAFVIDKAWDEIEAGRMPKGGSLTQTQKDNLLKWIESDYTDGVAVVKANYTTDIAPIINQNCATATCHDNTSPKAGLDLSTFALSKTAFQGNAWTRTNAGTMPPSGKLEQSKIDLIKNWIDNDFIQQ